MSDFSQHVSDEISLVILGYLAHKDLSRAAQVSKTWQRLTSDQTLWRDLFVNRFPARNRAVSTPTTPSRLSDRKRPREDSEPRDVHGQSTDKKRRVSPGRSVFVSPSVSRNASLAATLMEDREDWQSMYILQHNWDVGNCSISHVALGDEEAQSGGREEQLPKEIRASEAIAFTKDLIFVSTSTPATSPKSVIVVYRIEDKCRLGTLTSPTTHRFTKLTIEKRLSTSSWIYAGNASGGFTIWSFSYSADRQASQSGKPPDPSFSSEYLGSQAGDIHHPVIAIAAKDSFVVICDSKHELSIYGIETSPIRFKQLHQFSGTGCSAPIDLQLVCPNPSTLILYVAYVASTLPNLLGVGVQELAFTISSPTLLSPRSANHYTANPTGFQLVHPTSASDPSSSSHTTTTLRFRYPYLLTAHPDNTVQVYTLRPVLPPSHLSRYRRSKHPRPSSSLTTPQQTYSQSAMYRTPQPTSIPTMARPAPRRWSQLTHTSTLYAHAAAVTALDLCMTTGRMVTAGGDGIGIWRLHPYPPLPNGGKKMAWGVCGPEPVTTIVPIVSGSTRPAPSPEWIGFDEGRIIGLSSASFSSRPSPKGDRKITVYSFLD
ncbi:hypothetical protein DFS34DRAFT_688804 [Phlyctochytrium arcticum]|nr:hypothetical protein DFS34DRAFT_688804 [Phlyctochytrium arcticum]